MDKVTSFIQENAQNANKNIRTFHTNNCIFCTLYNPAEDDQLYPCSFDKGASHGFIHKGCYERLKEGVESGYLNDNLNISEETEEEKYFFECALKEKNGAN